MLYVVYLITRSDGKLYIGSTNSERFKSRMNGHRASKRFKNYDWKVELLYMTRCYETCLDVEEELITRWDTFNDGLNNSRNGRGAHGSKKFTTLGLKMKEETRAKISQKALGNKRCVGRIISEDTRKKWSEQRKGKRAHTKLSENDVASILELYKSHPELEGVGKVSGNGRTRSYETVFSETVCTKYGVTKQAIFAIIRGKTWNGTVSY